MQQESFDKLSRLLEQKVSGKDLVLPMLPTVTSSVLGLVNDVNSDASDLAKLVQSDQALAGHVMRIANSAAYSPTAKMTSLQQAIARLGMQNIAEIAMAATMGPKLFITPGFEDMVKQLWLSSLATAVWAKEISRKARKNVESTFLSGLLFQIGKPAVLQAAMEGAKSLELELDIDSAKMLMNLYQQQVGILLAEIWQLPSAVSDTIASVDQAGPAVGSQDVIDAVRAGKVFAEIALAGGDYDVDVLSKNPFVIAMNLYATDIEQLLEKVDDINDTIEALKL